mmetsp:Transcript_53147/g.124422  ORF Transcript_53147/g.124422 Transcript_53147/m.124422 type:complete len:173 (+) Transcript_53147:107-625(+)
MRTACFVFLAFLGMSFLASMVHSIECWEYEVLTVSPKEGEECVIGESPAETARKTVTCQSASTCYRLHGKAGLPKEKDTKEACIVRAGCAEGSIKLWDASTLDACSQCTDKTVNLESCDEITGSFVSAGLRQEHGCVQCSEDHCNNAITHSGQIAWALCLSSLLLCYSAIHV